MIWQNKIVEFWLVIRLKFFFQLMDQMYTKNSLFLTIHHIKKMMIKQLKSLLVSCIKYLAALFIEKLN